MGKISFKQRVEDVAGEIAQFCGFSQAMTYSFESPKVFDKLKLAADAEAAVEEAEEETAKEAAESTSEE